MAKFDKSQIQRWITIKGTHIPVLVGQTEEKAVSSFLENKTKKEFSKRESRPTPIGEVMKKVVERAGKNREVNREFKRQKAEPKAQAEFKKRNKRPVSIGEASKTVVEIIKKHYD